MSPRKHAAIALLSAATAILDVWPALALAQWTRVAAIPATDVFSVSAQGDTLIAGLEQAVWITRDGGVTWTRSADLPGPVTSVETARFASGRLWCGTYGRGVFSSVNLGATWDPQNSGLAGGLFDSHFYVLDLEIRGDSLFAATDGAGVFARRLSVPSPWSPVGTALTMSAAGGVLDLGVQAGRMLAAAGANGVVFSNDRGMPDWTESFLQNSGISPGLQARNVAWVGDAWVVSTQAGCFRSASGTGLWSLIGPNSGAASDGLVSSLAGSVYATFNTTSTSTYWFSGDRGDHWQRLEMLPTYTYELAQRQGSLFAGRVDGLWRRDPVLVGVPGPASSTRLALRLAGENPVRNEVRFLIAGPSTTPARLEIWDVTGRRIQTVFDGALAAAEQEIRWNSGGLVAGVYLARLTNGSAPTELKFAVIR